MHKIRVIARLDIKAPHLVKGLQLEGVRALGSPGDYASLYYSAGADEILYQDVVASLYGRNNLADILATTTQDVFVPICVGGGIRSLEDARALFYSGADKIALNTGAIKHPELITQLSTIYGRQAVVVSVEAKAQLDGSYEAYIDNGREKTGLEVVAWVQKAITHGAGEILLTSVDKDGSCAGPDIKLIDQVAKVCTVPLIVSGGITSPAELGGLLPQVDAIAIGAALHYQKTSLQALKQQVHSLGQGVRGV